MGRPWGPPLPPEEEEAAVATGLYDHSVVIGAGRVGGLIIQALRDRGLPFLVVEENGERAAKLRETFAIPNKPKNLADTRKDWEGEVPVWIKLAVDLGIKLD